MIPSVDQVEGREMASECKRTIQNHKSDGIPMKMLIAQEISKEENSGNSSPNLIAKLMGLDNLRDPQSGSVNQIYLSGHQRCHSEISMSNWEQQNCILDGVETHGYADVNEIRSKPLKPNQRDRFIEAAKYRQMAEAKRLLMDENLRQSKQFQDASDVLGSDKELFLMCLQEPKSVFSQLRYKLQSIPPPGQINRITVLKPSKAPVSSNVAVVGAENGKQVDKGSFIQLNSLEGGYSPPVCMNYDSPAQPTRIVVLKPSNEKMHADEAVGFLESEVSGRPSQLLSGSTEHSGSLESRKVAKAITEQMRKRLVRYYRDETMVSSAFSNGCVAESSSFNKSEFGVPSGNLSDLEVMSPASRHSWDHVNRIGTPSSSSPYSGISYSPESSVFKEAKKRLSERWAKMASNGSFQDQRLVQKTASTLGEMLSFSEAKRIVVPGEEDNSGEPKDLRSLFLSDSRTDDNLGCSPRSLLRSKSVPLLSTPCETKVNLDDSPVSYKGKPSFPEISRTLSGGISSIRGKVSSLLFSRNQKSNSKDKTAALEVSRDANRRCVKQGPGNVRPSDCRQSSVTTSSEAFQKSNVSSHEPEASVSRHNPSGRLCKNQDLESPVSVLDALSEESEETPSIPGQLKLETQGSDLSLSSTASNLIDKSPPIGSISRTISWDDAYIETSSTCPIMESISIVGRGNAEEEWSFLLTTLLTMTDLHGEVQSSLLLGKWHSPESPLDPSLRDKYIDLNDTGMLHEAKLRQKWSMQMLVFDWVNAALLEIAGYASGSGQRAIPSICPKKRIPDEELCSAPDDVFDWIHTLFSSDIKCFWDELGHGGTAAVVRKEVVGNGWSEKLRLEMDYLEMEIGGRLMEEMVQEMVMELTGKEAKP